MNYSNTYALWKLEEANAELEYVIETHLESRLVSKVCTAQLLALASYKIICRRKCRSINIQIWHIKTYTVIRTEDITGTWNTYLSLRIK